MKRPKNLLQFSFLCKLIQVITPSILLILCLATHAFPEGPTAHAMSAKNPDQRIQVKDGLISLDIRDADLVDVLKEIAGKTGTSLSVGEGIQGKVTVKMTGVSLEEALTRLCENRAFVFEYLPHEKAYKITRAAALSSTVPPKVSPHLRSAEKRLLSYEPGPMPLTQAPNAKENFGGAKSFKPAPFDQKSRPLYKPGELLVRFKPGVAETEMEALHKSLGSVVIGKLARFSLQKLKLKQGLNEEEAIRLYTASGLVALVERHALRYPTATPNDPLFLDQWALQKIQATKAWDINQGTPAITVAVIDTGVDYTHPDLSGNIWINQAELNGVEGEDDDGNGYVDDVSGWDFAGRDETDLTDEDADPMDVDGHGTHVAGIIAAKGNNGLGISGVCWNVKIMPIKIQADNSDYMEDWDIIRALLYAMDQGARIVNCSFGGSAYQRTEFEAFAALRDAGILAVCASGNDGYNTDLAGQQNYPSSYDLPNILSVGASNQADLLVSYSNYGLISVDLVAPGMDIQSTLHADNYTEASVTVKASAVKYRGIGMAYAGMTGENGIEAPAYSCGLGYPQDFPPEVSGNIALIQRGEIYFSEKVRNAQNAGAGSVIIYNNIVGGDNFDQNGGTLGSPGNWIPAISLSKADGKALVALGNPVLILVNKLVTNPSSYGSREGTSMATPQVTGVAGLILSNFPGLDYVQVKAAILNGVDKVAGLADKIASGGRLNAFSALCRASGVQGDLSCDGKPSLDDIILALRVLGDLEPEKCAACPSCGMDVNGDGRIGMEEAIYGLQKMSGE